MLERNSRSFFGQVSLRISEHASPTFVTSPQISKERSYEGFYRHIGVKKFVNTSGDSPTRHRSLLMSLSASQITPSIEPAWRRTHALVRGASCDRRRLRSKDWLEQSAHKPDEASPGSTGTTSHECRQMDSFTRTFTSRCGRSARGSRVDVVSAGGPGPRREIGKTAALTSDSDAGLGDSGDSSSTTGCLR